MEGTLIHRSCMKIKCHLHALVDLWKISWTGSLFSFSPQISHQISSAIFNSILLERNSISPCWHWICTLFFMWRWWFSLHFNRFQDGVRAASVPRIISPPTTSSNPLMMVLPHSQHGHHSSTRGFHSERREEVDRHSSSHHSRASALASPHGHRSDHVSPSGTSAGPHLHNSPHNMIQPHSPHLHHHSVHHPQPHYHIPPHYHVRPPFQMRPYIPGHGSSSSMKEDRIEGTSSSEIKSVSIQPIDDQRSAERKFQPLEPNLPNQPPNDVSVNRSSPYHPVRRRGEAAAMIDIGEGN